MAALMLSCASRPRLATFYESFFAFSSDKSSPTDLAYEAYCAVPLIYASYTKAITDLAAQSDDAMKGELMLFVTPLEQQSKKIALECLSRCTDAEHDGPTRPRVATPSGRTCSRPSSAPTAASCA